MENLELPYQEQNKEELYNLFPHLRCIDIPEFARQRPQILLGNHHRYLTVTSESVLPPPNVSSAVAERNRLGWVLAYASLPGFHLNSCQALEPRENHQSCKVTLEQINQLVKHFLNADLTSGIDRDTCFLSSDEKLAIEILNRDMKLVNGRYEVPMLWKRDDVTLPNNSSTAFRRLISTENTLRKKNLVEWANNHHKLLIDAGFAREASQEELDSLASHKRANFVIGFVVINPKKEKPRWVMDTACNHNGVSLNSTLLKGPDNLIPLTQALFHFRERAIATCADVVKQFHQIKIKPEDTYSQLYYWRDCDGTRDPKIFIFTSMLFGPTDSPAKANAVRIDHATKSAEEFPVASRAALDSMYMDDQFDSQDTVEEAVSASHQSIRMFSKINWDLVGFSSNASEVLDKLPLKNVNQNVAIELSKDDPTLMCCKVLGLFWNPKKDVFEFKQTALTELRLKSLNENYHPTKLEILSFVMRIFDCLGQIAHFIVRGRMIIQQTWKSQLDWETQIPDNIFEAWLIWMRQFDEISNLQIPRHYGYCSTTVNKVTLHIFTDASPNGYAAVGYLKFTFNDGSVKVQQVMAKSRVAPIKDRTIPKLELDGAVVGTRLAKVIIDQHKRMKIESITLWSDSEIVLRWIRGFHLRLLPYVAPRVSEIRDAFPVVNWRYCPSLENPADHGTKCTKIDFSDHCNQWYAGPEFLTKSEESWPADRANEKPSAEALVLVTKFERNSNELYLAGIFERVSPKTRANYHLYKRVIARCLRFTNNLHARLDCDPVNTDDVIQPDELNEAEKVILQKVQRAYWPEEIKLLMGGKPLRKKHSKMLISLGAFLGPDGLIRCMTRYTLNDVIPFDMKFPIVLPNSHETTDAIVSFMHKQNHHMGTEATVARLRSRYWIIAARQAVKRTIKNCSHCIFLRSRPYNIPTGDLPEFRITETSKAFEHCGADCFGPFTVYTGASKHKKEVHVVLFTCLTSRAIYLRRLESLSSNDMLIAIQELWTRRGPILTIRSDNGRNFLGCANMLTQEFRQGLASQFGIRWIFIPAYTPQWGGCWERLIKDVKRSIKAVLNGQIVSHRVFDCILYQTEDLLNSHPLTDVPANPNDDFPITPNLMVKLHPGFSFLDTDYDAHKEDNRWFVKRAQLLSKKICSRWVREYLPIIGKHSPTKGPIRDIKLGDFVIYCDPNIIPSKWPRGIVIKVFPGRDGLARVADIKLKDGSIVEKRSAYRLSRIEIDTSEINATCNHIESNVKEFLQKSLDRSLANGKNSNFSTVDLDNNMSTPNGATHQQNSFPAIICHFRITTMASYAKLERFEVLELLKSLDREPFVSGEMDLRNHSSPFARNIFATATQKNYCSHIDNRILKFTIQGGLITFADLLLSLASLQCEPVWIKIQDQSQCAPLVAFVQFNFSASATKLLNLGVLKIGIGNLIVSKPDNVRPMPLLDPKLEHALVKFQYKNDRWKIICSRYRSRESEQPKSSANVSAIPAAAPMLGILWIKRFEAFINYDINSLCPYWDDFRVVPEDPAIEFIDDVTIHPSDDFRKQIEQKTRCVTKKEQQILISVHANQIVANPKMRLLHEFLESRQREEINISSITQTLPSNEISQPGSSRLLNPAAVLNSRVAKRAQKNKKNLSMDSVRMALAAIELTQATKLFPNGNKDLRTATSAAIQPKPPTPMTPTPIPIKEEPQEAMDEDDLLNCDDIVDINVDDMDLEDI
jgi:transposase InsO family protein